MAVLTVNYPPRTDAEPGNPEALLAAWWRVLSPEAAKGWLSDVVFDRALTETLRAVTGFMPSVGEFLAFCRLARTELEDEAERAAREWCRRLPPPSAPRESSRPSNAALLRHIAIGKLRARHGRLLAGRDVDASGFTAEEREAGHVFSEAEIAAVLEEMMGRGAFAALRGLRRSATPSAVLSALRVGASLDFAEEPLGERTKEP